jgi:predicted transposase/invertase (TIGR01784 family)
MYNSYLENLDKEIEYIPITYDAAFKKVFENNKNLLKRFVISVLDLKLKPMECEISLLPNELPKENSKEGKKTLDINLVLNDNIYIDIEINKEYFEDIKKRNLSHFSKLSSMLLESDEDYKELKRKRLYQLNLNALEKQIKFGEDIIVYYGLKTRKVYTNSKYVALKYLEYYRNLYYNEEDRSEEVVWLTAFTSKSLTELNEVLSNILSEKERMSFIDDVIKMNKDEFVLHEWQKDKLDALVADKKVESIKNEGKAIGEKEKSLEIARNMLKDGISLETIKKYTSLTEEEIKSLLSTRND